MIGSWFSGNTCVDNGAVLLLALWMPWWIVGGRPRGRGPIARSWAIVFALSAWAAEGLRFNYSIRARWLAREELFGLPIPSFRLAKDCTTLHRFRQVLSLWS